MVTSLAVLAENWSWNCQILATKIVTDIDCIVINGFRSGIFLRLAFLTTEEKKLLCLHFTL